MVYLHFCFTNKVVFCSVKLQIMLFCLGAIPSLAMLTGKGGGRIEFVLQEIYALDILQDLLKANYLQSRLRSTIPLSHLKGEYSLS